MRSKKSQKVDLTADYPCPCRRRGRIVPIALTEAFGCDRCQQIFVLQEDGYVIEQLSTHYPYKRAWRWVGQQWTLDRGGLSRNYLPFLFFFIFGIAIFILLLATLQPPATTALAVRVAAALLISMLLVFMFWLACRR
ncbi:MAG: hypothetical protein HC886_05750 [Leptolyngbyaceae cyanobacterium SM1_1_3]|nr:hypothetical protein [Leptolyngbyaceae cyanobacterium SM1_1_3]NJN04073.1 hypothetical protein [Leptolyngbyaceae cyanobacterium RM1_1_2]NJO10970.1 hypothetical protein [Leptolyngbyaceae cyanobacterium SL_1_1]